MYIEIFEVPKNALKLFLKCPKMEPKGRNIIYKTSEQEC